MIVCEHCGSWTGLSIAQKMILKILSNSEVPITATQIGRIRGTTHMATISSMKPLIEAGLITQINTKPKDKAKPYQLTNLGKSYCAEYFKTAAIAWHA